MKKLREVSVSYFFAVINTLMLSRIFSQALLSIHKYKTFTKTPPASLLHCIKIFESFIREVSRFCDNSCSEFLQVKWPLYDIYSPISPQQQLQRNYQSARKKMVPIPLLVFYLVQVFGTAKGFVYLRTK